MTPLLILAALAEYLEARNAEPQWKPGQVVEATTVKTRERQIMRRSRDGKGWDALGPDPSCWYLDDEVTDVEPVVVLDGEDVRALRERRYLPAFEEFFAERGVDVR